MQEKLEWQERFNIGVDSIDKEHRQLFAIMNKMLFLSKNDKKHAWVGVEGIKYFKNHVEEHFVREEQYMLSCHFGGYELHKSLHDTFKKKTLLAVEKEMIQNNSSVDSIRHFLGVCI